MALSVSKPPDYDNRVFLNCPFDAKFKPLFDAIVFTIHDLGFQARHALIEWDHHMGILDSVQYQHNASISDLAGLDTKVHEDDPVKAISCVRDFLRKKSARTLPGAKYVAERYLAFQDTLAVAAKKNKVKLRELKSWSYANDLQDLMARWILQNPS